LSTVARLSSSFEIGSVIDSIERTLNNSIEASYLKIQFVTEKEFTVNNTFITWLKEYLGKKLTHYIS
jgi:hypothetical protein